MRHDYDHTTGDGQKRLMAESMGLPSDTYLAKTIDTTKTGDYGHDGANEDGLFRMVPSGDLVDFDEMRKRLKR